MPLIPLKEAIARTLKSLNVSVITHVPGYGGSESFKAVKEVYAEDFHTSFHEEVAYTVAHGAALVGTRAASIMKTHGFGKAANSIVHSLYSGTTAGMVTFLFDDPEGAHSDNILDIEPFVAGSGLPYKVVQPNQVSAQIQEAYRQSETLGLPYILLLDCRDVEQMVPYEDFDTPALNNQYRQNPFKHVVCPFASQYQYQVLKSKQTKGDWQGIPEPTLHLNPQNFPGTAKAFVQKYEPFFKVFQRLRGRIVTGDASTPSVYALPPYNCVDIVTYLGGSTPLALGAYLAGFQDTWAVVGDFSFVAAAHLGLLEAKLRQIPLKLLIFNNARAAATGGQEVSAELLPTILAGYQEYLRPIENPNDEASVKATLEEAKAASEMRILVLNYTD